MHLLLVSLHLIALKKQLAMTMISTYRSPGHVTVLSLYLMHAIVDTSSLLHERTVFLEIIKFNLNNSGVSKIIKSHLLYYIFKVINC